MILQNNLWNIWENNRIYKDQLLGKYTKVEFVFKGHPWDKAKTVVVTIKLIEDSK